MITSFLFSLLTLDQSVAAIAQQYWYLFFGLMFLIIFAETGLVVFPLLPGDSLLFAAGAICAVAGLNVHLLVVLLCIAAILGDTVNYSIGKYVGPKVFERAGKPGWFRLVKPIYLTKTQAFFEKYGGFTIVIGRWVPIVRTFAPFLAGVAAMNYKQFLPYNVIGGAVWVTVLLYAGFFFGNIPWVKENLKWVILGIVIVSILPIVLKLLQERTKAQRDL
jgi:membrane-associated protein